jgi:serine protease Do
MAAPAVAALLLACATQATPPDAPSKPVVPAPPVPAAAPHDSCAADEAALAQRIAQTAQRLSPCVVHLTLEFAGAGVPGSEASALVVDARQGRLVTVAGSLEQASRVAVRFANAPMLRPRRARLLGVDDSTSVGVLDVGPIERIDVGQELELVERGATEPLAPSGVAPADASSSDSDGRFVLVLSAELEAPRAPVVAGYLLGTLQSPLVQQHRFERLLRVRMARAPRLTGGVVARQDGQIVGLALTAPFSVASSGAADPLLAIPVDQLQRGFKTVVEHVAPADASAPTRPVVAPRPWLGLSATDLDEPEFQRHLGVAGAVVVREVFEASPALAAGLEPHDLVVGWNDQPVTGIEDLFRLLAASKVGDEVTLHSIRGPELLKRDAKLTIAAW